MTPQHLTPRQARTPPTKIEKTVPQKRKKKTVPKRALKSAEGVALVSSVGLESVLLRRRLFLHRAFPAPDASLVHLQTRAPRPHQRQPHREVWKKCQKASGQRMQLTVAAILEASKETLASSWQLLQARRARENVNYQRDGRTDEHASKLRASAA